MPNPEHSAGPEHRGEQQRNAELGPNRQERKELAPESREQHEKNIEKARAAAEYEAISGREAAPAERKVAHTDEAPTAPRSRKESYAHTMKNIQTEMSTPARAFSKVIHNPVVERTSEFVGSTVARPDAILSGSVFACLLVLCLYLLARYNGFELRGFETIGAFIIGWVVGIIFDGVRSIISRKHR